MSRRDTKTAINQLLKMIGEFGLEGTRIEASSPKIALQHLVMSHALTPNISSDQAVHELRRQQLVDFTKDNDAYRLQLTVKGIHRLQYFEITSLKLKKPKQWDKRWRLVMFDIPARKADARYILTSQLKRLGFVMIQKSFWVYPYPCHDLIEKVITYAHLGSYVSFAEISNIDTITERKLFRAFPELKK